MKKTLLITGGTGYIGSHAVVAFSQLWIKVVIVDNLSNSNIWVLENIKNILWYEVDFFHVDLRDAVSLKKIFETYHFDGVLHFAGLKSVWESTSNPWEYFDVNISGSLKLFEMMEKFQVKNIIFSSSATVYQAKNDITWWYTETDEVWNCSNPYGTTKHIIEQILTDYSKFKWFQVANLRYFNPIWAHPSGKIGENPNGIPNNLLPILMQVAKWVREKIQVFWNDYPTPDGSGIRDYIDVNDLIDWHIQAWKYLENTDTWIFEIFNLGTGYGTSVLEMITKTQQVTETNISYEITQRRPWDLAEVYCNPNKAKNILWWKPQISIEESIQNNWKFINK